MPRLDLTPVLATTAAELDGTPDTGPESHSHQGMLLLEDAPRRKLEMDDDADDAQQQPHSGEHRTDRQPKRLTTLRTQRLLRVYSGTCKCWAKLACAWCD